ncbi:carbohydrate kinase family protein [Stetteria hydrogenophila]
MGTPQPARQRHVVVGNINIDITLVVPRIPGPDENVRAADFWLGLGGAAVNYTIATVKFNHEASLVARTGREAEALGLLDELRRSGVDISHVRVVDEPTGVVVVLLLPSLGSRSMITIRGANEALTSDMIPDAAGDVLHLASVKPKLVMEACERTSYDYISYDPGGEAQHDPRGVGRASSMVDVLMLNYKELEYVAGGPVVDAARRLLRGRLKYVAVKLGSGGAVLVGRDGMVYRVESFRVEKPVDVTGAGDAFDAAFNVWFLETGDVRKALEAAAAAGAVKATKKGSSFMPSRREVEEVLALRGPA